MVMPSNNSGFECGRIFGRFPDRMGHLHSVASPREPKPNSPWALDNGVFGAFTAKKEWDEEPFYDYLDKFADCNPIWAVVPDSVGNKDETLKLWEIHHSAVAMFGVPLAFAVQDGMVPSDVPNGVDVVFVGGTTAWKWKTLTTWTKNFPRVHVGRVNTERLLWMAHLAGAESTDGTGWFRGCQRQLAGLIRYLEESTPGVLYREGELF